MCDAVGHPVVRLVRTRIGPIADRSLKPGAWRSLSPDEVRALETQVAGIAKAADKAERKAAGAARHAADEQ
jgi:23S rRNA pseudouridine2605 synthase